MSRLWDVGMMMGCWGFIVLANPFSSIYSSSTTFTYAAKQAHSNELGWLVLCFIGLRLGRVSDQYPQVVYHLASKPHKEHACAC